MAKTEEELKQIKEDVHNLAGKMSELSDEEIQSVVGGSEFADFWEMIKKIGKEMHSTTTPVVK